MFHIFKIPEGARNVKSFIEEQTVLTVEDFTRGNGTLRVAFHHHEVSLEQLVAFQAAVDAEYLVEKPLELLDAYLQLRVVVQKGDGFLAFETTRGAGARQVVRDFTIDNKALRALHDVMGLKELLMRNIAMVVEQIKP